MPLLLEEEPLHTEIFATLHFGRKHFLVQIYFLSSNFVKYKNFNFLHWDKEIRDGKEGKNRGRIKSGLNNKYLPYILYERKVWREENSQIINNVQRVKQRKSEKKRRNVIARKECIVPWNKNLAFMMSFLLALTSHPPNANTARMVTSISSLLVVILSA